MKWRILSSILSASLVVGIAAPGCGSDDGNSEETPTPPFKPDPNAAPKLVFVTNQSQTLSFEKSVDLTVRYVDGNKNDAGIAGAPLDYAIVGESGGSKLSAMQPRTNANGEATVTLTAGKQNATFQVSVTPPTNGGAPISFQVAVSDKPIGSIGVSMAYLGELKLENLVPSLYQGVTCDKLKADDLPTPIMTTSPALATVNDTTAFVALNVAKDYAVTVTAKVGPNIRAFGCVDNIEVVQSDETKIKVPLADLEWPGPVLGTYDLTNLLDFGGTLPESVELAVTILDELTDDHAPNGGCDMANEWYGEDPGAFITDFLMRQTCHWECKPGEDFDNCSQINHGWGDIGAVCQQNMTSWDGGKPRFFGGCGAWETAAPFVQNQINDLMKQYIPEGVLAFANMAGDLARAINKAKIYSQLNVQQGSDTAQPMTHRLVEMEVLLHDLKGKEHIYKFNLADVGLKSLQTNANLSVDGIKVTIPEHEFKLSYGKLIQYIYLHGLLPLFGYTSTADMIQHWVNCTAVGQWIFDKTGFASAQDWAQYCTMGITLAGDTLDSQISGFIKSEGTLKLQGICDATDIDINNIAQTLSNGKWLGQWGEDAGSVGNVSGTFTGKQH